MAMDYMASRREAGRRRTGSQDAREEQVKAFLGEKLIDMIG